MKERGILFTGAMIRAILDGRKTMTRRVLKVQPPCPPDVYQACLTPDGTRPVMAATWIGEDSPLACICPHGVPGDTLWVREAFALSVRDPDGGPPEDDPENYDVIYRADPDQPACGWRDDDGNIIAAPWKPSIHMPRWASRITLEVTGVRVERVQDISEEDAIAEGIYKKTGRTQIGDVVETIDRGEMIYTHNGMARDEFAYVWNKINAARGFGWEANPWCWVIEFKRIGNG